MIRMTLAAAAAALWAAAPLSPAQAEILAMVNYESKTEESLEALKLSGPAEREEGILILDVDPESERFGQVLWKHVLLPEWNSLAGH